MIIYQAYNPISNKFYIGKTIKPIWEGKKKTVGGKEFRYADMSSED